MMLAQIHVKNETFQIISNGSPLIIDTGSLGDNYTSPY